MVTVSLSPTLIAGETSVALNYPYPQHTRYNTPNIKPTTTPNKSSTAMSLPITNSGKESSWFLCKGRKKPATASLLDVPELKNML